MNLHEDALGLEPSSLPLQLSTLKRVGKLGLRMPPTSDNIHVHLEHQNMRSYLEIGSWKMSLVKMMCPYKKRRDRDRHPHGECHVAMMEVETGVMCL